MYLQFKNKFSGFPIIPLSEIYKAYPNFDRRRLVEWQRKGYIEHIKRGFYRFHDQKLTEGLSFLIANKIYTPSYISLETALWFYGLIPEATFTVSSVSTQNTTTLETSAGSFSYRHINNNLFFAYKLILKNDYIVAIASLEKAVLDYLYLNTQIISVDDFESLRWNKIVLNSMNFVLLEEYLNLYKCKALKNRVNTLKKYLDA
jgi:predicted transcriptional regulator of viral defense system